MSLENEYDAWVRSLMGGRKYAASPEEARAAPRPAGQNRRL